MTSLIILITVIAAITIFLIVGSGKVLTQNLEMPFLVVYSGMANHFLNGESVGGKLFLTSNSLYFKSHSVNLQNHEIELNINQIREVRYYNMLGIIRNMLVVETIAGKSERFVVNNRAVWKEKIEEMIINKKPDSLS